MKRALQEECEEILRRLVVKHDFLHPESPQFDVWSRADAAEVVADIIILIKASSEIEEAAKETDWGK